MRQLTLTIKKRYFDAILAGTKTYEFREVKPHWSRRLRRRTYDSVLFINGYQPDSPRMMCDFVSCRVIAGLDHPLFGEAPVNVFAIKLKNPREIALQI